jgi:hypothetical protein
MLMTRPMAAARRCERLTSACTGRPSAAGEAERYTATSMIPGATSSSASCFGFLKRTDGGWLEPAEAIDSTSTRPSQEP